MAAITRAEIEEIIARLNSLERADDSIVIRLDGIEKKTDHLYAVVWVGTDEQPPHKEVIRLMAKFLVDNEKLPETVRTYGRWIENINKLGWAAVLILLGILINNIFNK